jgi:hypothetical protein
MTHRQEMILGQCHLALTLTHRPQFFAGEAVLVQGLMGTDYNWPMQQLFKSAVSTPPDEDYEDNTLVVYLTRSMQTEAKLKAYARHNVAPAVEVIVKTYHTFDPEEILDILADLEDGTRTCRYLIIEDSASDRYHGTREQIRKMRSALSPAGVLFVTSSPMCYTAGQLWRMDPDADEWLPKVAVGGYERQRNVTMEFDIAFVCAPAVYDPEEEALTCSIVASKCRGAIPISREIVNSSYKLTEV